MSERLKEATERRAETDRENQRLLAEIRTANSKTESLILTHDTDNNKALELAETRITTLEKQVGVSFNLLRLLLVRRTYVKHDMQVNSKIM
mgnify:FL=1